MKKPLAVGAALLVLAVASSSLFILLTKDKAISDDGRTRDEFNETYRINFTEETNDTNIIEDKKTTKDKKAIEKKKQQSSPAAKSRFLDSYSLFFREYPFPCDPSHPPRNRQGPEPCDYAEYHLELWGRPSGLQDFREMIMSDNRWKEASQKTAVFFIDEVVLRYYLKERDPVILDGLERLIRRGQLGIQTFFIQASSSNVWRYDPLTLGQCCAHPYSQEYASREGPESGAHFPWDGTWKDLKNFILERDITNTDIIIFLDTYDAVPDGDVEGFIQKTTPTQYAREVVKQVKDIRAIFESSGINPITAIHELNPRDNAIVNEDRLAIHIRAFKAEADKIGTTIDAILMDKLEADPRPADDPCRIQDEQNTPPEDMFSPVSKLIAVAHEEGLKLGLFAYLWEVPYPYGKNDPCQFPKNNQDVVNSYLELARHIRENMDPPPDFYLISSWAPYPDKGLPETDSDSITYALLKFAEILDNP